jgi:tetratricopeptide (TPR) repeat protein
MSRIEMLQGFIAQRPNDPFPRYALALELKNAARLDEARDVFEALMNAHPAYTAAYLHAGNTFIAMGRTADARAIYVRGIEACLRAGDAHARGELEGALAALPAAASPG